MDPSSTPPSDRSVWLTESRSISKCIFVTFLPGNPSFNAIEQKLGELHSLPVLQTNGFKPLPGECLGTVHITTQPIAGGQSHIEVT